MSKLNKARPRLGRGLSSLLSLSEAEPDQAAGPELAGLTEGVASPADGAPDATPAAPATSGVWEVPVDAVRPNPHQPRREFNEASITELAASLKSTGLIQPIVVRPRAGGYELIAGERRLRAAKVAGLATVPAIVKEVDSFTQAQMALIENIQREDLNPIDRALAYRALIDQLGLTQGELAGRLGQDRTAVNHFLRLLDLSEPVRTLIRSGKLTVGHGKLLAGVSDPAHQLALAERAVSQSLSVRNLERVLEGEGQGFPPGEGTRPASSTAHLHDLEKSLSRQLGMRVQVKWNNKRQAGKLIISYDLDQFDQLKERLGVVLDE